MVVLPSCGTAPAPPGPRADYATRRTMAADIAAREDGWRAAAEEGFPADRWSQRDDFHGKEAIRIRELAGENRAPIEDVLRAIDEDLHRVPPAVAEERGARAVPCKPRPFYD